MNLGIVKLGMNQLGSTIVRNSPSLLTALGCGGVLTTAIFAMKGKTKADRILFDEAYDRVRDWSVETGESEEAYPINPMFTPVEEAKLTWQCYIPAVGMGLATILCIIGANSIHLQRNAALASLYGLADTAFKEYKAKVVEQIGERKEEKVREAIEQDKLDKNPVDGKTIIVTGGGDTLCYEDLTGRYFKSSVEKILTAQNQFNYHLIQRAYMTLNDFYDILGLEHTVLGRASGWQTDRGIMEIGIDAKVATENNTRVPCVILKYVNGPGPL